MSSLTKICVKCNRRLELKEYYSNRKFREELYRDRWCKDCIEKLIIDEKVLKEYFYDNRRKYPENYWGKMYAKAKVKANEEYRALRGREKEQWIIKTTRNSCFRLINFNAYYKYEDPELVKKEKDKNKSVVGDIRENEPTKVYNHKWCGYYTDADIKYLEDYYKGLDDDFRLSNHSYRDYAKKVCKASLAMDKAFSEMQVGMVGAEKKYKELKTVFDTLSQSAKFAEKTRSVNDVVGFGSFGELINKIEEDGFLNKPVKFNDDDIDLIVDDFRYVIASVGEKF